MHNLLNPYLPARAAAWSLKLAGATILAVGLVLATSGCTLPVAPTPPSSEQATFTKVLNQLGSTQIPSLQDQANAAMAETPPNTHIAQCAGTLPDPANPQTGTGAMSVAGAIQKLAAAAGPNPSALVQTTVALAFAPHSAQFDWAAGQIEQGCVQALQDAINAGKATAADLQTMNIATVLALAQAGTL
jgi:hypothetical protein